MVLPYLTRPCNRSESYQRLRVEKWHWRRKLDGQACGNHRSRWWPERHPCLLPPSARCRRLPAKKSRRLYVRAGRRSGRQRKRRRVTGACDNRWQASLFNFNLLDLILFSRQTRNFVKRIVLQFTAPFLHVLRANPADHAIDVYVRVEHRSV